MPEQFVAVSIVSPRGRRRSELDLLMLRFDRHQDLELVRTDGAAIPGETDREIGTISWAAARRMLAGRTTIVPDRSAAAELRNAFGSHGELPIVAADELRDVFRLEPGAEQRAAWTWHDPHALAQLVRDALRRAGEYDAITLSRAAGLAAVAEWPVAGLLQDELDARHEQPVLLRPEHTLGAHELSFLTSRERPEPLKRSGDTSPVSVDAVEAMLGPGGAFSKVLPVFERRRAQQEMAASVAGALNDDGWLLVEAGTGTGKSV
ncbi:MAG: hypothetical protein IT336_17275, partial [Thermomicrobiales bacterium]|nr:hypothetical protein [Thermomicrobiales bacterium]